MQSWGFYYATVSFALGVGVATSWTLGQEFGLAALLFALGVGVVWRRSAEGTAPHLFLMSICLCFFAIGILRTEMHFWQFGSSSLGEHIGENVTIEGVITREPDYRERTVHLYVETETDTVLVTTERYQDFSYGDVVVAEGTLRQPEAFVTELGRTFDYRGYLLARGVEYSLSFASVEKTAEGAGNTFISWLLKIKHSFMSSLEKVVNEPMAGLGEGLLLGVKQALGEDIEEDFRQTGIIHIVVLSGYNVMLVVAFILFCFSFFLPLRYRVLCGLLAIGAFALIVGLSATVVRASIMASLVLVAQLFYKRYDVLRGLFVAGFAMLILNPYLLLYDIGFQLSFVATLGLILLAPQFETAFVENKWLGVRSFLVATIATQIAVLPLLMYHIGEVSLISVVVNVLVLPIVPVAMLLTFITGVLGVFAVSLAQLVAVPATLSLQYILLIAEWFARLPFAAVTVPDFGAVGVLVMYGLYFGVYHFFIRRDDKSVVSDWVIEEEEQIGANESLDSFAPISRSGELPPILR